MKMKKFLYIILAVVLLLATFVPVSASAGATNSAVDVIMQGNLTVTYNGDVQIFCDANGKRVLPLNYQGTTYLPVRAVCALVGFGVDYDSKNYTVILSTSGSTVMPECKDTSAKANKTVSAVINRRLDVTLDGKVQTFTDANGKVVYPLTYAGTTYVPVRAMANLAGIEIDYVSSTRTVVMTKAAAQESTDKDYLHSLALDAEFGKVAQMVEDGTIDGYVLGETKFLVWKSAATGINSVGKYEFEILDHNGAFERECDVEGIDADYVEHLGSDIFKVGYNNGNMYLCYNAMTEEVFYLDGQLRIHEGFSEGFAIATSSGADYFYTVDISWDRSAICSEIILVGDNGDVTRTGIYWKISTGGLWDTNSVNWFREKINGIGKYGNGVFLVSDVYSNSKLGTPNNGFYDKTGAKVLDLGNLDINNEPYFDGEYCWIEYKSNGFVWGAYMDINGNFVGEAAKMYEY